MMIHNIDAFISLPDSVNAPGFFSVFPACCAIQFVAFEGEAFGQVTYNIYGVYPTTISFSNIKR